MTSQGYMVLHGLMAEDCHFASMYIYTYIYIYKNNKKHFKKWNSM